jgi:nucleotidyltransferase/DNA polymerase involved in DNA repair
MEQLLVVWVESLALEQPDGSTLRATLALLDSLDALCPFSEVVRLGLYALPLRGPSRFFGGDEAVMRLVRECVLDVVGTEPKLGVAEGLFCAELAAQRELVVPLGSSDAFRRAQPLEVLGRKDLTTTCQRLGLNTVGAFADLDPARVGERFNRHALYLHRVARGELSEMEGQRDPRLARRLAQLRGEEEFFEEQQGFFGQRGAGDDRADAAAHRVRRRLGAEAVVVASLRGGRGPEDRATLVPWGSPQANVRDLAPWPGQLAAPSPATTLAHPVPLQLRDAANRPVVLNTRGTLSAEPAAVIFSSPLRREIIWHAGPWPLVERWWSRHRRRAHLQMVLASGEALLVVAESSRWWLVGIYD